MGDGVGGGRYIARHTKKVLSDATKQIAVEKEMSPPQLGEGFMDPYTIPQSERRSHANRVKREVR